MLFCRIIFLNVSIAAVIERVQRNTGSWGLEMHNKLIGRVWFGLFGDGGAGSYREKGGNLLFPV